MFGVILDPLPIIKLNIINGRSLIKRLIIPIPSSKEKYLVIKLFQLLCKMVMQEECIPKKTDVSMDQHCTQAIAR